MTVEIVDLDFASSSLVDQIAAILVDCFKEFSPTWVPDLSTARMKVENSFAGNCRSRVLLNQNQRVLGWIGTITHSHVWEIHPIAVSATEQGKGYGRMLVTDIADIARSHGAVSIWAGTGDETGGTSIAMTDLYENPARWLQDFHAPDNHPANFWLKIGFTLVGVLPDEEGLGKPGIHFAKRIV